MLFYQQPVEDVYKSLYSSERGLRDNDVKQRQKKYGRNRIKVKGEPLWRKIAEPFLSVFMVVLILAVGVSIWRQEVLESGIIVLVITVSAIIYYVQRISTELVLRALSKRDKQLVQALRNGQPHDVSVEELVPGDIIYLFEGQKVPADARIVAGENIRADEALLTGEDKPINKNGEVISGEKEIYDQSNMIFSGSFIVSGEVIAIVAKTGNNTEFGQLADIASKQDHHSPVQGKIDKLVSQIIIVVIGVAIVAFVLSLMRGAELGETISFVLALAVSAVPEGLPVAISVVLVLGMRRMAKHKALVRSMGAIESVGLVTTIATDKTGTLTKNKLTVHDAWSAATNIEDSLLGHYAGLSINNSKAGTHDPLDSALGQYAKQEGSINPTNYKLLNSFTFEQSLSMSGNVWKFKNEYVLVIKGAPEKVFEKVHISKHQLEQANNALKLLTVQGFRVIAIARAHMNKPIKALADMPEGSLKLEGLVAVADILRPEAKSAVAAATNAGIKVSMITGDHVDTAFHIGRQLGIAKKYDEVFDSREMSKMNDSQLSKVIDTKRIFARVIPENKYRILNILKKNNVTAMTGDGVNDVPALANAHIGVAMGSGSQIAKEAGDIVLLNDNFKSIVEAVREGRIIFANIRRMLFYLLATSSGEVLTMIGALLIGLPLPVVAVQILWINLVTDTLLVIPLGLEPGEKNAMKQPPRDPKAPLLDRFIIIRMVIVASVMAVTTLTIFYLFNITNSVDYARTIAFNSLVVMQWANALNARSETESIFTRFRVVNLKIYAALLLAVIIQSIAIFGPLSTPLHVSPVNFGDLLTAGALSAFAVIAAVEVHKLYVRYHSKRI